MVIAHKESTASSTTDRQRGRRALALLIVSGAIGTACWLAIRCVSSGLLCSIHSNPVVHIVPWVRIVSGVLAVIAFAQLLAVPSVRAYCIAAICLNAVGWLQWELLGTLADSARALFVIQGHQAFLVGTQLAILLSIAAVVVEVVVVQRLARALGAELTRWLIPAVYLLAALIHAMEFIHGVFVLLMFPENTMEQWLGALLIEVLRVVLRVGYLVAWFVLLGQLYFALGQVAELPTQRR